MILFTSDLVTAVSTAILTLVGGIPLFVGLAKKWGPVIEKEAPLIAEGANMAEHAAEDILKMPRVAALEADLKAKVSDLKKSELAKMATTALHAFEKDLSLLTPNEKVTLLTYVHAAMGKLGVNVTDAEILNALGVAQKVANDFKSTDAFKNTAALEASLEALKTVQTTADNQTSAANASATGVTPEPAQPASPQA